MNFFKVITLIFISLLLASNVFGDNHDTTEKELLEGLRIRLHHNHSPQLPHPFEK